MERCTHAVGHGNAPVEKRAANGHHMWRHCTGADSERVKSLRENAFIDLAVNKPLQSKAYLEILFYLFFPLKASEKYSTKKL